METFPLPKEFNGYTVVPTTGMNHVVANLVKGNKTVSMVAYQNIPNNYYFVKGMKMATVGGAKGMVIRANGKVGEL